ARVVQHSPRTAILKDPSQGGSMRALRTPASVLVLVVLPLSLLQAVTNFGYVANNSAGTVSVINTTTHAVVATVSVGSFPYGIAVDEAGKSVYVTNAGSNTVSV